jgi:hypothetical protein
MSARHNPRTEDLQEFFCLRSFDLFRSKQTRLM